MITVAVFMEPIINVAKLQLARQMLQLVTPFHEDNHVQGKRQWYEQERDSPRKKLSQASPPLLPATQALIQQKSMCSSATPKRTT